MLRRGRLRLARRWPTADPPSTQEQSFLAGDAIAGTSRRNIAASLAKGRYCNVLTAKQKPPLPRGQGASPRASVATGSAVTSSSPNSTKGSRSRAKRPPDIDAVPLVRSHAMSAPSVSRSPVNSASPSRSSPVSRRVLADRRLVPGDAVDVVLGRRRHSSSARRRTVECAPQPKPRHSPSVQYFRLWRDRGQAARRSRFRTADSRPPRAAPSRRRYMSAASSSGACDQAARAISSRSGAFGYTSSRYSDSVIGIERDRASTDSSHSPTVCRGSHIIRSRLTLSNPARARFATARRAPGPTPNAAALSRCSSSSRNDWTPKLTAIDPGGAESAQRARSSPFRDWPPA